MLMMSLAEAYDWWEIEEAPADFDARLFLAQQRANELRDLSAMGASRGNSPRARRKARIAERIAMLDRALSEKRYEVVPGMAPGRIAVHPFGAPKVTR
jgi:hypothetical protein